MQTDSITLFRPVGQKELDLISESGFTRFPPRLPEQPIFYPVLNREYAEQIARDWNTRDERSGFIGYVLEFEVGAGYLNRFELKRWVANNTWNIGYLLKSYQNSIAIFLA
jgi:hypothetical protein